MGNRWQFMLYSMKPGIEDAYRIYVDAESGTVELLEYIAQGNG